MKIWPTRTKAKQNEPVADLDSIIAEPVSFRFHGKIHSLKPMRLDEFLKFTNAQAVLMESLRDSSKKLTVSELAELYHKVVSAVCDTVTVKDILSMEQAQVAALYQLVIDLVTGQVNTGDGTQKKRVKIPIYESALPSSLQSAPASSVGQSTEH